MEAAPAEAEARARQAEPTCASRMGVLRGRRDVVEAISDRLVELADRVPEHPATFTWAAGGRRLVEDPRIFDYRAYPPQIWKQPGEKAPNRAALAAWGAWVNSFAKAEYGRPLFIAASADLAESTHLAGFGKDFGDGRAGAGTSGHQSRRSCPPSHRVHQRRHAGRPATVNLADDPMAEFNGFWGACSTYGSFSYLKYGEMRLFSQLAQDTELKVGKLLWVAGRSGRRPPRTRALTSGSSRPGWRRSSPGVT